MGTQSHRSKADKAMSAGLPGIMPRPRRKINRDEAIEFLRELLGKPDASEEELIKLAKEAIAKVKTKRVSIDLKVSPSENARLRRVLALLLKEDDKGEK